jgi:hypothetical protein
MRIATGGMCSKESGIESNRTFMCTCPYGFAVIPPARVEPNSEANGRNCNAEPDRNIARGKPRGYPIAHYGSLPELVLYFCSSAIPGLGNTPTTIPEASPLTWYTRSVAFTKSVGLASGMLTKLCGLRSVSGNQEL